MDSSIYGDLPRKYRETADAVVLELGDDADPRLVRRLAQECFDAIGYYAPAGEGYPDGDVTVCLTIEHDIRLDLEKADAHGAA